MIAIQKFVKENGYYDDDNPKELNKRKSGKGLHERMQLMQGRMTEINSKNKNKYAGKCGDFAFVTTALLRGAGFLSGIVQGYLPEGKVALARDAHAASFVLWPTEDGKNEMHIIDGTPNGTSPFLQFPTIKSIEELFKSSVEKIKLEEREEIADEKIKEIVAVIDGGNHEKIEELKNGKLESTLNEYLSKNVNVAHLHLFKRLFEAFWYTPLKDFDLKKDKQEISEFFDIELESQRGVNAKDEGFEKKAGGFLIESIHDFAKSMIRHKYANNFTDAFDKIKAIVEIAEDSLNNTEIVAIRLIIKYLKAEQMDAG